MHIADKDMSMKTVNTWPHQLHTYYVGKSTCKYVPTYLMYILDMTASYIYCRFTDLQDQRMWIGNGQPRTGACRGNPTHTGRAVDINYYTILDDKALDEGQTPNATQYRPTGISAAQIWDGTTFIPERFHWDANYTAFRIMKELGIAQYRTCNYIREEFRKRGYDITGMNGDFEFKYNHHTHAHIMV